MGCAVKEWGERRDRIGRRLTIPLRARRRCELEEESKARLSIRKMRERERERENRRGNLNLALNPEEEKRQRNEGVRGRVGAIGGGTRGSFCTRAAFQRKNKKDRGSEVKGDSEKAA